MNKTFIIALSMLLMTTGLQLSPVNIAQAASATKIEQRSAKTLTIFKQKVKSADSILSRAKGILVMPAVYQGGIGVGGKYGEGALKVDGKTVDYYNMIGASYGLQLGGQKKSLVIAFMDDHSLQDFRSSNGFEFGVDATAAVITAGADGQLNVTDLNKPILAFAVDQKGLMYNLSLAGSKFSKIDR